MSGQPGRAAEPTTMLRAFPSPSAEVRLAYRELHLAAAGTPAQQEALGNLTRLPRPWDPATCVDPELRHGLWEWLEEVVTWLNQDYSWDLAGLIPACWPLHAHLVHEIAVVADQRRRAGLALTSDALEEWHRYCLPAFADRMQNRLRSHCDDGHRGWPAKPRHSEHVAEAATERRQNAFAHDVDALLASRCRGDEQTPQNDGPPRLGLVDLDTGELQDDEQHGAQKRTRTEKGPRR